MEEQNIGTKKLDKKKKIILTIIAVLILTFGVTLAYIIAQLQDEARGNVNVTSDAVDILRFEVDKDITLNPTQFNVTEGGDNLSDTAIGSAILRANSTNDSATYNYYVYFQINSNNYIYTTEEQTPEIVLTITNPEGNPVTNISGLDYVTSGGVSGFDITTKSGLYEVAELYEIISNSSTKDTIQEWEFTVSFINLDTNQYENGGKTLEAEVILSREPIYILASYITNVLYTGVDGDNGIYYHDGVGTYTNAELDAGDNSYRFSGSNPNNYVCFGSDAATCPSDNLYRIIGVFNDTGKHQVKLIKWDYANSDLLGTNGDYVADDGTYCYYYWNNNTVTNSWSNSNLNTINLNTNYLTNIGEPWRSMITTHTWQVGGMGYDNVLGTNAQTTYNYEVGENAANITVQTKIGLMYLSDYAYAASPGAWSLSVGVVDGGTSDYISSINTENNWLLPKNIDWTISCNSDNSNSAWIVNYVSYVLDSNVDGTEFGVRPSFYLSSSVVLNGGSGTESDPFRIGL